MKKSVFPVSFLLWGCIGALIYICGIVREASASMDLREQVINIQTLSPLPNYKGCTDAKDRDQLTDGRTVRYPIWIRQECVGWAQKGSVCIHASVPTQVEKNVTGILECHTAIGTHAEVALPARIDLYGSLAENQFYHVGALMPAIRENGRAPLWLQIPINHLQLIPPQTDLLIFVRPHGKYLFMDELRLKIANSSMAPSVTQAPPLTSLETCRQDAAAKYRNALLNRSRTPLLDDQEPADQFWIWQVPDPFGALSERPASPHLPLPDNLLINGARFEKEILCLGLRHTFNQAQTITLRAKGNMEVINHIEWYRLEKVLTAKGHYVFDPILPLKNQRFSLPNHRTAYLWIQFDLTGIPDGVHDFELSVHAAPITLSLPTKLKVFPLDIPTATAPYALNWSYSHNQPIWASPANCLDDLIQHGINVFIIHPSNIPQPGEWNPQKERRLRTELMRYRNKGRLVLLYLFWHGRTLSTDMISTWSERLKSVMQALDYQTSDWALYPVDEPCGPKLKTLRHLATVLKKNNPEVRIYANPTTTKTHPVSVEELAPLEKVIDIFQPSKALIDSIGVQAFKRVIPSYWIYANPIAPAKMASPENAYYFPVLFAWAAGAKGVGFWAYSDTAGSSAWDDLDGRRPDYAVVYEGINGFEGPISSRRWEAFRKGIEIFRLFNGIAEKKPLKKTGEALDRFRQELLTGSPGQGSWYKEVNRLRQKLLMRSESAAD